jgi:GT2 family glycosyltransferase
LTRLVAITVVTFNSERYIEGCLERALLQDYENLQIIVVDNASHDSTVDILRRFELRDRIRIFFNDVNTGFAGGQNQAIAAASEADWILTLNPDVRLPKDFIRTLVAAGETSSDIGSACGKLLAATPDFELASPPLLDSAGIYFTPELRHFDRGNHFPDRGQFDLEEFVFGATGAACLYRQAMIRDIRIFGEFFDNDFFSYREDADVAWRAQLFGWKCIYTPKAVAMHVRTVVPKARRSLPPAVNLHSVKNRWLLRFKNTTPDLYLRFLLRITLRDIVVIGGCLLREWSSLPAFAMLIRLLPQTWRKRREIMRLKRTNGAEMRRWFSDRPVSFPATLTR